MRGLASVVRCSFLGFLLVAWVWACGHSMRVAALGCACLDVATWRGCVGAWPVGMGGLWRLGWQESSLCAGGLSLGRLRMVAALNCQQVDMASQCVELYCRPSGRALVVRARGDECAARSWFGWSSLPIRHAPFVICELASEASLARGDGRA